MDLKEFFNKKASVNGGLCYSQVVAKIRRVEAGDKIYVNNFGLPIFTNADEDGYHVEVNDVYAFLDDVSFAEFQKDFTPATPEELGYEKIDLPEDASFKSVRKGERIVVQPFSDTDLFVEDDASQNGYVVTLEGKTRFFSDLEFRAIFNVKAAAQDPSQQFYKSDIGTQDAPARYIVLGEKTVLPFKEADYTADKGEILVENETDVDGYTVYRPKTFEKEFTIVKAAPTLKA